MFTSIVIGIVFIVVAAYILINYRSRRNGTHNNNP